VGLPAADCPAPAERPGPVPGLLSGWGRTRMGSSPFHFRPAPLPVAQLAGTICRIRTARLRHIVCLYYAALQNRGSRVSADSCVLLHLCCCIRSVLTGGETCTPSC